MTQNFEKIRVIDSHTEGEPTRLVIEGFPDLGNGNMAERLAIFKSEYDHYRKAIILEPRGNDVLVGALLCQPQNKDATAGVIFFNNEGYLGMCGHGTIGLMASLYHLGLAQAGKHTIETPVGNVVAELHEDGSVSLENVYAYRYKKDQKVMVESLGEVVGDIAWGGNWFFLVNQKFLDINLNNVKALSDITLRIMAALKEQGIRGNDGQLIDHIELFQESSNADSQSFVMCPGGAYDRSPCGTGTSAKLACLAAEGSLAEGQIWVQSSVIGSKFYASYQRADADGIIPTIRGTAHVCGDNTLLLNPTDPFCWGIVAQ